MGDVFQEVEVGQGSLIRVSYDPKRGAVTLVLLNPTLHPDLPEKYKVAETYAQLSVTLNKAEVEELLKALALARGAEAIAGLLRG